MDRTEIKEIMKEIVREEVSPVFLELLKASEQRIDETNRMVQMLAKAAADNQAMYDKHLTSLEQARDCACRTAEELIKANMSLTKLMEDYREDYRKIIQGYRDELQSAKHMYNRVSEAYIRIAEKPGSGSTAEVTINK